MKKRVGLIGYGTIGKYVFEKLSNDDVEFTFVFDKAEVIDERITGIFTKASDEVAKICEQGLDLVVEAATPDAVKQLAPTVLKYADMMIFSTCALADISFQNQVERLCLTYGHNLYIPHGAILGLDGIQDGRGVLREVSITTIKKPKSWGRTDEVKTTLYEGTTRNACEKYPRNVNVHASTALAGLGFDNTYSRMISDPNAPGNMHIIEVNADGCRFKIEVLSESVSGVTGAYTPVSACSAIRRVLFSKNMIIV